MNLCSLSYLVGVLDRASAILCGSDAVTCPVTGRIITKHSLVAISLGNDRCMTTASEIRPKKHFLPGLTKLSERDSSGLEYTDPTALWRISCYSHGLCQRLGGDLVATATAQGIKNRLMYDNQYDRQFIRATGIAIKFQKGVLSMSICSILCIIV